MTITTATPTRDRHQQGARPGYVPVGLVAGIVAAAVTFGLARAAGGLGVDFELPDGEESIPWVAFPQMVVIGTLLGLVVAACLRRWNGQPARAFVRVAVTLTALTLVLPFLVQANAATAWTLVLLHLVPAAMVIPAVASRLDR